VKKAILVGFFPSDTFTSRYAEGVKGQGQTSLVKRLQYRQWGTKNNLFFGYSFVNPHVLPPSRYKACVLEQRHYAINVSDWTSLPRGGTTGDPDAFEKNIIFML
jgi:hypothetical protein